MTENLTTRVARVIAGSLNALVDAVEDAAPEIVMEQAIREVDQVIEDVRHELGKAIGAKHLATTKLADKNTKHDELSAQIEVALKEKREDLAEAAVAHQLDVEAQIPVLERSIGHAADKEKELESYIGALQAKKREMQEELKLFRETMPTTQDNAGGCSAEVSIKANPAGAVSAFNRVMERNTNVPGGAIGTPKSMAQLQELETLAQKNRINERLAEIKSRLSQ